MSETKNFKIKTAFYERPNGSLENQWPAGIDIGYSSVKVFSPNGVSIFPSFAKKTDADTIGTLPPDYIEYTNLVTGEKWVVGEAAQNELDQNDVTASDRILYSRQRYDAPMFLVLVDVGLGLACMKNGYDDPAGKTVYIETGLPSKYLNKDSGPLKKAFSGRHQFSLKIGTKEVKNFDISVDMENVDVMDQPMGTLMSIAIGNDHKFVKDAPNYFNKNVIIFDGGHGTLDVFAIRNNKVDDRQTLPDCSMKQIIENTRNEIAKLYGEEVSPLAMQRYLETGMVVCHDRLSSEEKPFGDILLRESQKVCDEAIDRVSRIFNLADFNYFVITGGTCAAWEERIREMLKNLSNLKIVTGNQNDDTLPFDFANVRGYYFYLYEKIFRQNATAKKEA